VNRHTTRRTTTVLAAFLLIASFVLAACGDDTKVGSDNLKDFKSESGSGALGGATTTVAPVETTAAPAVTAAPVTTAKPAPVTTAKPAPTTTAPTATTVAASIVVKVQGDAQGNAFEPSNTRVYGGSVVRFENTDSAAHQVRARNGEFQSPSIAPGGTWDFKVNLGPGNYEFTDATRPYAVGYLEVVAQ
jgi:plastocyanin/predicted small secreted protein